jgi:flagellar basal-body rod modification protein FlgD
MTTTLFNNTSGTANSASTSSTVASQSSTTSDMSEMFTKLLVAQIQNQDPLEPTDPSQFVNQLAQLSQTESLQSLSTLTSSNNTVLQSMQVLGLGAQVGSNVSIATDTVKLDGSTVSGSFDLTSPSSKTTLVLTGTDGQKHNVSLGTVAAGTVPFAIDPTALGLPAGTYSMAVETSSSEVPSIGISGKLSSVRVSSAGSIVLNVANVGEVTPAAVTAFNGNSSSTASASTTANQSSI